MATSTAVAADALPVIDLRLFTQSELRALAKSTALSSSTFDFGPNGDVPVPKIDRAVFNESAGSRKQTYSRLRLAPRKTEVSGSSRIERVEKVDEVDEWENRKIVTMLKELVGEVSGEEEVFEGLVDVDVMCDPELDVEDVEMVREDVTVEIGSVSPVRRKRGRPRKDDSNVYVNKIVLDNDSDDREDDFGGERLGKGKVKKRDEDDMEMMNKNGVMVDVLALGNADDPFGLEIRRRTEGMSTKEQLLEFLNGLEGQWVSRRRKRKIVDASDFGDVLPRGWKLVFSIKKKAGYAWLICRQYLSPSGREFISCKEVSSYLQHLSGMQSEEHKISNGNDKTIVPVDTIPKENTGYQVVQGDTISDQHPSTILDPNLANQVQRESEISLPETAKGDIAPHVLPSSPKLKVKRRKLGTLVSEGVILTDGKFECQFCHKIFEERRRYNGHVGVHVRSVEALRGSGNKAAETDLGFVGGFHSAASGLDITVSSTSGSQANHNDVTLNAIVDLGLPHTNLVGGAEVRDLTDKITKELPTVYAEVSKNINELMSESEKECKMTDDVAGTVDSSNNFGAEMNQYIAPQIDFVKNRLHEFGEGRGISMSDFNIVGEDGISEKSTVVFNEAGKLSGGDGKSNGDSACLGEKLITDKTIPCENNVGGLLSNGNEEHTIDFTEQFGNEKSPFNIGMVNDEQDNMRAFYQQRNTGSSPIASFLNEQRHISTTSDNEAVASRLMDYKGKISVQNPPNLVSNTHALTGNDNFLDGISGNSSTPAYMHPSNSNSGIQPALIPTSNHGALGVNDWSKDTPQKIFGVTYLFPSLNQNVGTTNVEATSSDVISKSPWKSPNFNPQLAADCVAGASNSMASKEFWKEVGVPSNNVAKIVNEVPLDMAAVSSLEHGKGSGGYPFSSHGGEQGFNIRNEMIGMGNSSLQEIRPERDYVSDFVNQFENGQNNRGNPNMFPSRPLEQSRVDEIGFPLNNELKISLGNDHSRLDAVNRNMKGQSLVLSGNEHFGLQNNSNSFYNRLVEARDQRASGSSLMDQYGQHQMFGLQNNLNQAYNGSMWGGQRIGAVGNFGSNHLTGFASGQPQRSENVLSGGNWSVGVNADGLSDNSLSRDQPSGYMHNFQMMSSKGDNQLLDAAQKFNNVEEFQDQRGGIQQREYNFLNDQAKPYAQEPNVMPYGLQMQQSYDPASWLGRHTSFPQVPGSNPPPASCVWCSNIFYPESLNSFSQADTIIPTCPSCKAKTSEQLNLF